MTAASPLPPGWHWRWHDESLGDDGMAAQWDGLAAAVEGGRPFLRHGFLSALVDSGSAARGTGWAPLFLTLHDAGGTLKAACPVFVKTHSYGEYVFDWAWADAHDRAFARQGSSYYPKLLSAVPFSPIPGARLLVDPALDSEARASVRRHMLRTLVARVSDEGWSSVHILFLSDEEAKVASDEGWLTRHGVQFHWTNQDGQPYQDFDQFLATLHRDKRKKIKQERRRVQEAGVSFQVRRGGDISTDDWDFFYRCYEQTYFEHGQRPYLNRSFWAMAAQRCPEDWLLFVAHRGGNPMAASLLALDETHGVAYGRYWGALENISCLHFEACYYQPLQWCIDHGFARFEGGAQGEHKLARGLLPIPTRSVHWLAQPQFRKAVADFVEREGNHVQHYIDELDERNPFKSDEPPA